MWVIYIDIKSYLNFVIPNFGRCDYALCAAIISEARGINQLCSYLKVCI